MAVELCGKFRSGSERRFSEGKKDRLRRGVEGTGGKGMGREEDREGLVGDRQSNQQSNALCEFCPKH